MGYDLHITRAELWIENDGKEITAEEWLKLVDEDPELRLAGYNGPYFALWSGPSQYPDPWLDWSYGNIYSKNPDEPIIEKMVQIAKQLGAKVQGDDGELCGAGHDLKRLLWKLQASLQALAQQAEVQLALFSGQASAADKMLVDLVGSSRWLARDDQAGARLPPGACALVEDLRSRLQLMKDKEDERLWTNEALKNDPRWDEIRELAAQALADFGWPNQPPPKGWSR